MQSEINHHTGSSKEGLPAIEKTQQAKALAAKPDDLSSVSATFMVEGEDQPLQAVL